MAIVSLDDVTGVKTAAPLPDVPIFRHLPASEVKVVWKCTAEALDAANAGVAMYNKRMRPIFNLAEQRHIAGLYDTSDAALGAVDLDDILEDPLALPFVKEGDAMADSPFTWCYSRRGTAGGGEDAGAAVGGGAGAGAGGRPAAGEEDTLLAARAASARRRLPSPGVGALLSRTLISAGGAPAAR